MSNVETNLKVADQGNYIMNGPLSPKVMRECGVLGSMPTGSFAPNGDWAATYRIWYTPGRANREHTAPLETILGLMHLTRTTTDEPDLFSLTVDRYLCNETDRLHRLRIDAVCRCDRMASPVSWTLRSDFQRPDGTPDPRISRTRKGSRQDNSSGATSSFGLFEAVQRLEFGSSETLEFALLDEFDLEKPGHCLRYRGTESVSCGDSNATLHCFQQIGWGQLPIDYWLDEQHRLLVAVHSPLAYIHEELAVSALPELLSNAANQTNAA